VIEEVEAVIEPEVVMEPLPEQSAPEIEMATSFENPQID
jgi:hypothetical protein